MTQGGLFAPLRLPMVLVLLPDRIAPYRAPPKTQVGPHLS